MDHGRYEKVLAKRQVSKAHEGSILGVYLSGLTVSAGDYRRIRANTLRQVLRPSRKTRSRDPFPKYVLSITKDIRVTEVCVCVCVYVCLYVSLSLCMCVSMCVLVGGGDICMCLWLLEVEPRALFTK